MKFRKLLALILTIAVCVSFMPVMTAAANAAQSTGQTSTQSLPTTTYTGDFPSLPSSGGAAIAQTAINLAWPYGTAVSKYAYSTGSARDNFKTALEKAYPDRSGWGAKPKVGASCDVFVGTVLRYSGYDGSAPRGCGSAYDYYPAHPEKWTDTGICKVADMQPGDVILWRKASGTCHTCIYVEISGVGYIAEAHYSTGGGRYGCIDRKASDYTPSKYTYFHVFRANSAFTGCIDKGCTGTNVTKLQKFLNWAGYDCGTPDGSFGAKTLTALKAWQTDACITSDGRFGKASLAAAKTFVPSKPPITYANTSKTKTGYSGPWPTKTLKKGSRGTQVKYLQKFLKWYGISVAVDGKYGNSTKKAVKKFQKKNSLKQDGVFGKASLKKAKSIRK